MDEPFRVCLISTASEAHPYGFPAEGAPACLAVSATPPDFRGVDDEVRSLINDQRRVRGLPLLKASPALRAAAEGQAQDMASHDHLSHYGADGSTWIDRCVRAHFPGASPATIGENVAGWQVSPAQAVADWMRSPGHRAAILGNWTHCAAAGAATAAGRAYWCADFGRATA